MEVAGDRADWRAARNVGGTADGVTVAVGRIGAESDGGTGGGPAEPGRATTGRWSRWPGADRPSGPVAASFTVADGRRHRRPGAGADRRAAANAAADPEPGTHADADVRAVADPRTDAPADAHAEAAGRPEVPEQPGQPEVPDDGPLICVDVLGVQICL